MNNQLHNIITGLWSALKNFVVHVSSASYPSKPPAVWSFLTLIVSASLLAGCKPEHRYETVLSPTEPGGTGTECLFTDGSVAGHVYNIQPAPDGSRIALIAVSDSAALKF